MLDQSSVITDALTDSARRLASSAQGAPEAAGLLEGSFAVGGRLGVELWKRNGVAFISIYDDAFPTFQSVMTNMMVMRERVFGYFGAPWTLAGVEVRDRSSRAWVDFDERPHLPGTMWERLAGRDVIGDLEVTPRASELVPAWMKVELATAGCWDVDRDVQAWDSNLEPSARPVSREVAEAAFAGQRPVSEVLFGPGGAPVGLSRSDPLVLGI